MPRSNLWLCLTGPLLAACGGPYQATASTTTGITGVDTAIIDDSSTSGSSGSTSDTDAAGSVSASTSTGELSTGSSSDTAGVLDVGADVDLGDPGPPGCKGKIDFLFVISRYENMQFFQEQLLDAFPKFIETIETKFAGFDFHIMVVDGTRYWGTSLCDDMCPKKCIPEYPCHYTATTCDHDIGGGVVYPVGSNASNKFCGINGGRRYITKSQANLKDTFACVAQVGSSGWHYLGEALTAAMQPEINAPGGCNAGFLRDDALLMVTMIAANYDIPGDSIGTPKEWMEAVRSAKHGKLDSVVILSILDDPAECAVKDRTCQMVKMFPFHMLADRDALAYGPVFDQATDLAEEACEAFTPPG